MNSGLTSRQQQGHMETGSWILQSHPKDRRSGGSILGFLDLLVVQRVITFTTTAPISVMYFDISMPGYNNSSADRMSGVWLGCWIRYILFVRFTTCKY